MLTLNRKSRGSQDFHRNRFLLLYFCAIVLLLLTNSEEAKAGELVHGKFLSSSGKLIQLQITTGTPPPSHIIVSLEIPPGVEVNRTQPDAQKIRIKKGKIKWLLKNVQSGSQTFSVELSKAIKPSVSFAIVRYRDPATGNYIKTLITP